MNKPWKLVLLLTGIFLAGGVTGALLTAKFGRQWVGQRPAPGQWGDGHLRRLARHLELRPEQVEQLKPIVRRNMEELGRLRAESMTESRAVFERMEREISAQLTPEQRSKFDEYNREARERVRRFMQKRPGGTGHGDRREGPPGSPPAGGMPREPGT
jgi:Spy/CpxP family protein refolding chaperone